jgi:serine/threonine protein kinase
VSSQLRPHKNVVQFFGICSVAPNYCIVLEYMQGGSLQNYLKQSGKLRLNEVLFLLRGIAAGNLFKINLSNIL